MKVPLGYSLTLLTLAILLPTTTHSQFTSSLPTCVQNCINSSQDDNCSASNVACLCRASSGNFLLDVITCMHANCDNNLDSNLLLTPLQVACNIVGAPIPDSAIRNAENLESSLAAMSTTTMTETVTAGGASATSGAVATTTSEGTSTGGSKTSSSINPDETDSAPFKMQSSAYRLQGKTTMGSWFGLGVLILLGCFWF